MNHPLVRRKFLATFSLEPSGYGEGVAENVEGCRGNTRHNARSFSLSLSLSPSFDLGARFQTSLADIFFFLFLLRESTLFLPFSYIPRYFLSRSYLTYTSASFSISARYVSYCVCFLFPLLRRFLFFSFPLHLRFLLVIYIFSRTPLPFFLTLEFRLRTRSGWGPI